MQPMKISRAKTLFFIIFSVIFASPSEGLDPVDLQVLRDLSQAIPPFGTVWSEATPCFSLTPLVLECEAERVIKIEWNENPPVPQLSGTLPESIGNLTKLQVLELSRGLMNGTIPATMGKLVNLVSLGMFEHTPGLTGTLPKELGNLLELQVLRFYQNSLTGTIPQEFLNFRNLTFLDLNYNQLEGTIPNGLFANNPNMEKIYLNDNKLNGTIPDEFYSYTPKFNTIWLFNNNFTGFIPPSMSAHPFNTTEVRLEGLNLTGCFSVATPNWLFVGGVCKPPNITSVCDCSSETQCGSESSAFRKCPYCPSNFSCIGAKWPPGFLCTVDSQCISEKCANGTCSPLPPSNPPVAVPETLPPPTEIGAVTNAPSGGTIAAIIVIIVVLIGLALLAAFFIRRYIRKRNKPTNDVFDVYDRESRATHQPLMGALTISSSEYNIVQELGKGSQGSVFLATFSGEFVAVKQLYADAADSPDELEALLSEADVMASIRSNKNVVKLVGVCRDDAAPAILMEFCPRGSLSNFLRQKGSDRLSEYEMFKFAYGTVEGMIALARSGVLHRDLAARNILLSEKLFPKVSDFGFSGLKDRAPRDNKLGPIKWQSPEVLKDGLYSEKSDVWAFGCVLVELATSREPYDGFQGNVLDLISAVRDQSYNPHLHLERTNPSILNNIPDWMLTVMRGCFKPMPDERPQFLQIRLAMNRNARNLQTTYDDEVDDAESLLNRLQYAPTSASLSTTAGTSSAGSWVSHSSSTASPRVEVAIGPKRNKVLFEALGAAGKVDLLGAERLGKLGSGSFGSVFLGTSKGTYLALKVLSVAGSEAEALKEAHLMMNIQSHRNIIQLYGMISQNDQLTICMEFAPRGALESLVYRSEKRKKPADINITEGLIFRWAVGIARGMAALAASNIVHRDLAVRNILLDSDLEPKISDFGLARTVLDPNQESNTQTDIGPIRWFAPECFDLKYSEKTDVWAYGCSLVEIITGEPPMGHLKLMDVVAAVRGGRSAIEQFDPATAESTYPLAKPWIVQLLKMCFVFDPKLRPSFAGIVAHLEAVGPTIQEIRDAEAEIQKRRDRRADVRSMRIKD